MPERPKSLSFGGKHKQVTAKDFGSARVDGEAVRGSAHSRGYSRRWQKARITVLQREPLCRVSLLLFGETREADVLDHFYPHRRISWLFWTRKLWVPMSKRVHDGWKQEIEAQGEAVLDHYALELGLPVLSVLEPERIAEWRAAPPI